MKSIPKYIMGILMIVVQQSLAQNLVVNGDFESFSNCPTGLSQVTRATGWYNANTATTDYYNACVITDAGVPANAFGNQAARSGLGYGGMVVHNSNNPTYREYLRGSLTTTLVAGQSYYFEMYISRCDNWNLASNKIGVHFTSNSYTPQPDYNVVYVTPQIMPNTYFYDQSGWELYSGTFIASGNETQFIIGNFESPSNSTTQSTGTGNPNISYYYVDDVSLVFGCDMPFNILGNDKFVCGDSTVTTKLDAFHPNAQSYLWNTGETTSSILINKPGTYWVRYTSALCQRTDTIQVTYKPVAKVFLGNDTTLCSGNTLRLGRAGTGATLIWSNATSGNFITVSTPGWYWVYTNLNGCQFRDSIFVQVENKIPIDLGPNRVICLGDSVRLESSLPSTNYTWNTGASSSFIQAKTAGIYWLEANNNGCKNRDSITVAVAAKPNVNLGLDTGICNGGSIKLRIPDFNPAFNYKWKNGSTDSVVWVNTADTIWVKAERDLCRNSDTIITRIKPLPLVDLGPNTTICGAPPLTLNAGNPGAQYSWNNGQTTQQTNILSGGLYWVTVTQNGCAQTDSVSIAFQPKPPLELGENKQICEGDSVVFNIAIPSATYSWNDGSTLATFTAKATGMVKATVNRGACSLSDSVWVNLIPNPQFSLGPNIASCLQSPILLASPIAADSFKWNQNQTDSFIWIAQPGWHWLKLSKGGCSFTDSIFISQLPIPSVALNAPSQICVGDSIVLDAANTGGRFNWNTADTTQTIMATAPAWYWIKVTNTDGCFASDTLFIDTFATPVFTLGNDTFVCKGSQLIIKPNESFSRYAWSTGETSKQISIEEAGSYSLTIHDHNNCQFTDGIAIETKTLPNIGLPQFIKVCEPKEFAIKAKPGYEQYLWNTGDATNELLVNDYGIYAVTVTDSFLCSATSQIEIGTNCPGTVITPNAFTPNNDGVNDDYLPQYRNVIQTEFNVYNRWGELLFTTNLLNQGWNGTYGNQPMPADVYIYQIKYTGANNGQHLLNGNFTLIR